MAELYLAPDYLSMGTSLVSTGMRCWCSQYGLGRGLLSPSIASKAVCELRAAVLQRIG